MKRLAIAALFVAFGAAIVGAQVVPQPAPPSAIACAYNATPPTLTDGQAGWVQCDSKGNVLSASAPSSSSAAGVTPVSSTALVANQVIKASAGNLYSLVVSADSTLSGAAWWVMIYNSATAPSDGAVTPLKCYALASGTTMLSLAFPTPIAFSTGITAGVSTSGCFTKTASTHAFISGDAQ